MPRKRRKSVICNNCDYRFDGIDNYCPNCGQENHSHHAPFRHIFLELIEGFTHFDTKFITTAKSLFLHPGLLTKDYIADRRARSVPPLRLYIFSSFLFFLVLSLFSHEERQRGRPMMSKRGDTVYSSSDMHIFSTLVQDSLFTILSTKESLKESDIDSLMELRGGSAGWIQKVFMKQTLKLNLGLISKDELEHTLIKNAGISVFILMPLFALLLTLLYIRKKKLYIEHLIFSIHFHSFIFAFFAIAALLLQITGLSELMFVFLLFLPVYCILAMRNVYGGSWWKTILKGLILFPVYFVNIFIVFILTVLASVVTL